MSKKTNTENAFKRWIVPVVIISISIIAYFYIWSGDISNRQDQVLQTLVVIVLAVLTFVVWLAFFSPFPKGFRRTFLVAFFAIAIFSVLFLRIRSVSGDVLPVLEWRWAKRAPALIDNPSAAPPSAPAFFDQANTLNDYPQFLGPERNGKLSNIPLARDWNLNPPKELWRQPIGTGWSAFAIVGNSATTQEQRGEQEMVVCYDLLSGKIKWSHGDSTKYDTPLTGAGPHATPTIAGKRVFTLGATDLLNCLNFKTGEKIWSKNILHDNEARRNAYGISNSPLVLDSLVIVSAGGRNGKSLVAYHAETGRKIWVGDGKAHSAYSSPFLTTFAGQYQIIQFNLSQIMAYHPLTGSVIWQEPWPKETQSISQPVALPDNRLFVSSGYGIGCKLFQISQDQAGEFQVAEIWKSSRMKAKLSNVVYKDGFLYGLDDGVLACIDPETAERKWKGGRYGHGQLVLVDDLILVQSEQGDVVLLEATPEKHTELASVPALNSKTWNHPALAAPYLLVRNDKEAVCFELALESQ